MQTTDSLALATDVRVCVAIDLIGDLDATLGDILSDTLGGLVERGTTDIVLMTKHVAMTSEAGIHAIDAAIGAARASGCSIVLDPGSRRMKAAFAAARIHVDGAAAQAGSRRARHLMIARHAERPELRRTA
jgi:anti-anti-sigma regulatory factor